MSRSSIRAGRLSAHRSSARRRHLFETLESRRLLASVSGQLWADDIPNGVIDSGEGFFANQTVYVDLNNSGSRQNGEPVNLTDAYGRYAFNNLDAGTYAIRQDSGFKQSYPAGFFGLDAKEDGTVQLFEVNSEGDLFRTAIPRIVDAQNPLLTGLVRANDGQLLGTDGTGDGLYQIDSSTGAFDKVGDIGFDIVDGLAYDSATENLYSVGKDSVDPDRHYLIQIDQATGVGTAIGVGVDDLGDVADLTFEPGTQQIVGYSNSAGQFFRFGLDGTGSLLAPAAEPVQTGSLTFDGTDLVMASDGDASGQQWLKVNPITGAVEPGLVVSESVHPTSLFYAASGPVAQRVTLGQNEDRKEVDFGLDLGPVGVSVIATDGSTDLRRSSREDSFSVVLDRMPLGNVVIDVSSSLAGVAADRNRLAFNAENWQTPQEVKVRLRDDSLSTQTAQVQLAVNGDFSGLAWRNLTPVDVPVNIVYETFDASEIYISEVFLQSSFDTVGTAEQYLELRGEPDSLVPDGTYFVAVDGNSYWAGSIETVIDLSGLRFGSNGFLVLLPDVTAVIPNVEATVLQSTAEGFSGLPDNRFETTESRNAIHYFSIDAQTYMVVHSDSKPELNEDIDTGNRGVIDGVGADWSIHDSVARVWGSTVSLADRVYSPVVFVDNGGSPAFNFTAPPNAVQILGDRIEYMARIGGSVGGTAEDWVGGSVGYENYIGAGWELDDYTYSPITTPAFTRRQLDHVGDYNFIGGVYGEVYADTDRNGERDSGETPLEGVVVLADTNGNGIRDVVTERISASNYVPGIPLDSVSSVATFRVLSSSGNSINRTLTVDTDFQFNRFQNVFSTVSDLGSMTPVFSGYRIRADFFRPVNSASVTFIGGDRNRTAVGWLEAYDANGQLLQIASTANLALGAQQTISVATFNDDIAYFETYYDGFTYDAYITDLQYEQREAIAVTDADGKYRLPMLATDDYQISAGQAGFEIGGAAREAQIERFENFEFNFGMYDNSTPEMGAFRFLLDEHERAGSVIGSVFAIDPDLEQTLQYRIAGGSGADAVAIDSSTGRLTVRRPQDLDFEQSPTVVLAVEAVDPLGEIASGTVTIDLKDINDQPTIVNRALSVSEKANEGSVIGRIEFFDVDSGLAGEASLSLLNDDGTFSIDSQTGMVRLIDNSSLDFETRPRLTLLVEVVDQGNPATKRLAEIPVVVRDSNESPSILTESLIVSEAVPARGAVGKVAISDVDAGQNHFFRIVGGTGQNAFVIDRLSGMISLGSEPLDYETSPTYTVDVLVSDSGSPSLSDSRTIQIDVTNINEPPVLPPLNLDVVENVAAGSVVAELAAIDPESGQEVRYKILGGSAQYDFDVDPVTGLLTVASGADLDFEKYPNKVLTVEVSDNGSPPASLVRDIPVQLQNAPEYPLIESNQFQLLETLKPGAFVGLVQASDPDDGDSIAFEISGGTAASLLEIDSVSGALTVADAASFNFEELQEYSLEVTVSDSSGLAAVRTLLIQIVDGNEAPVFRGDLLDAVVLNDSVRVKHGYPLSLTFEPGIAVDPDAGQTPVLTMIGADGPLADWLSFDPVTGILSGVAEARHIGFHAVALQASDQGNPKASAVHVFTIEVLPNEFAFQNGRDRFDVDNNQIVVASDALAVINYLNRFGSRSLQATDDFYGFVDVNGDNFVSPTDALDIINRLGQLSRQGGMGEAAVPQDIDVGRTGDLEDEAVLLYLDEVSSL
ncbi:Cadherin domain protein [Roseimaritima multifibrata]|uniref:Cadherin domain protein n=1 Tax=Roseimaritima multifibrata TaxID=1930274 RepID=A0A517MNW2_9BACT|nr:cadherin domain-containing protein [Roseimaritima multifibrata]QDS96576.1 Cadherin domain protein [Roseimaritima multifibrata]